MEISSLISSNAITSERGIAQQTLSSRLQDNSTSSAKAGDNSALGKDDFLKLLVTQLKYQDPTKPLEDKEFVSQMAQFTSLEQMTNLNKSFESVSKSVDNNFALSLIGKTVDVSQGDAIITGLVDEVRTGANPQISVNGVLYSVKNISRVGVQEVQ